MFLQLKFRESVLSARTGTCREGSIERVVRVAVCFLLSPSPLLIISSNVAKAISQHQNVSSCTRTVTKRIVHFRMFKLFQQVRTTSLRGASLTYNHSMVLILAEVARDLARTGQTKRCSLQGFRWPAARAYNVRVRRCGSMWLSLSLPRVACLVSSEFICYARLMVCGSDVCAGRDA